LRQSLWCGSHQRISTATGIGREDGRPCKSNQVIMFKGLHNLAVHITELRTVAFVKDDDHMLFKDLMAFVLRNEYVKLLNGRYDDMRSNIL